jgi:hypothetical protein
MSDERYAPPTAALGDPTRERGTGRIDLGEAFREAWAALWANFPLLLGVSLLFGILALLAIVTVVGAFLVLPVLTWGGIRFILNVYDGSAEVSDLFSGFSEYGRALGSMLVLGILIVMIYSVGQALQVLGQLSGSGLLTVVGGIVNLAWGFLVVPRLAFVWFYVVDEGLAPVEALQTSWSATTDQKLTCFLIAILSGLIPFIGVLCLIVGVIPAMMLVYLLQTAAYRQLVAR